MDRLGRRIRGSIREGRPVVLDGGFLAGRRLRDDERLDVEASDELLMTSSLRVGLDVALVPRQSKGRIGDLDHEEIELRVRR